MLLLEENNYIGVAFITLQANFFIVCTAPPFTKKIITQANIVVTWVLIIFASGYFLFCRHEHSV